MAGLMRVKPSAANRRGFAKWAVQLRIRTVEATTFGVPEHLFAAIPEELLHGALVDGQRYVPAAKAGVAARPARATPASAAGGAAAAAATPAPVAPPSDIAGQDFPANVTPVESSQVSDPEPVENLEAADTPVANMTPDAAVDELSRLGQEIEALPAAPAAGEVAPAETVPTSWAGTAKPTEDVPLPDTPERAQDAESPQRVCHCGHIAKSAHGLLVHIGKAHNGGED